jgi:hypothetical protein
MKAASNASKCFDRKDLSCFYAVVIVRPVNGRPPFEASLVRFA